MTTSNTSGATLIAIIAAIIAAYVIWVTGQGVNPHGVKLPKKPIGNFKLGERIVILGLPMSGKSTLAAKLVDDCPRVLFFDPFHDYTEMAGAVSVSTNAFIENPGKYLNKPEFRVSVTPEIDSDFGEELDAFIKIAREVGDLVMVMDEVGDYKRETEHLLAGVARTIRHNGIVPIFVSQVATDIPKTVRRLASTVYSFRQDHPDDLEALEKVYGEDFANKVANLPEHEFATWTRQGFNRSPGTKEQQNPNSTAQQSQSQSGEAKS